MGKFWFMRGLSEFGIVCGARNVLRMSCIKKLMSFDLPKFEESHDVGQSNYVILKKGEST